MSAPIAIGDVVSITYVCSLFSQTILSVLHARCITAPTTGATAEIQLDDLAAKCADSGTFAFLTAYKAAAANNFFFDYVQVQKIKPSRTIYARALITDFGSYADPALTANLACSIEKQSTAVGRDGVGRLQFAALPNSVVSGGNIDAGYRLAEMTDLATAMYGNFAGGAVHGGVYAWCLPASGPGLPQFDVYNAFPNRSVRTMHRRTLGLGI